MDIDDTEDKVHGSQQLSLFNGYFKNKCYQPLHIYEGQTVQLITTLLRPGARPSGPQIVTLLKRLVKYLRQACRRWSSSYGAMPIFLVPRSTTFATETRCISPSDRLGMRRFPPWDTP